LANVTAIPGHIMGRSILFGLAVLVAAFAVAGLKHALAGH
jgi:hypothetical protein